MSAENETSAEQSLSSKLVNGAAWTITMRWLMRCMGLISVAILARILTPADFGLMAMATAVIALTELLTSFGVEYAIIRNQDAKESHFNTAWTMRLLQCNFVALIIVAVSQPAAQFFEDERVTGLLLVAALGVSMAGLENIGVVLFRRDLDFKRDFMFNTAGRLGGAVATIVLALALQSYWALVLGLIARNLSSVAFSYILSPYRPRLSLAEWDEMWSFSKWNLGRGLGTYGTHWLDKVFVSQFLGASAVGLYNVANELSKMAAYELYAPLVRVLVPGLAKLNKQPERLRQAFLKTQNATVTVALPATLGIGLVATELVPLILGPQWLDAVPLLQVMWIYAAATAIISLSGNLLMISGHVRIAAFMIWAEALFFAAAIYPGYLWGGIIGVAVAKGAVGCVMVLVYFGLNKSINGIRFGGVAAALWRPIMASIFMSVTIIQVPAALTDILWLMLAAKVTVGGVVYLTVIFVLWVLSGKPDGIETLVMSRVKPLLDIINPIKSAVPKKFAKNWQKPN